jgi:ABC-type oligopeptide transport system substrate-binding subunit
MSIGDWTADYLDPYDFINVMLNGANDNTPGSENIGAFNDPHFNQAMNTAATLAGQARLNAYAHLDANLMRTAAPIAPIANVYLPELISKHIRFDCSNFPPQIAGLDLATTCLK